MYKIGCPGFIAASINFLPRHGWTAEDIEAPVCLKLKKGGNGGHAGGRGGQRRWSSTPAFDLRHSASFSLTHTYVQTIRWRKSTLSILYFCKIGNMKVDFFAKSRFYLSLRARKTSRRMTICRTTFWQAMAKTYNLRPRVMLCSIYISICDVKRTKINKKRPWLPSYIIKVRRTFMKKWEIRGLFFLTFVFSTHRQLIEMSIAWIRTVDLWSWKRPLSTDCAQTTEDQR